MKLSTWLLGSLAAVLSACVAGGGGAVTEPCGDGYLDPGEQCDDGNTTSGDGCSTQCQIEDLRVCGDGSLAGNEQCDDGNTVTGDGCSATCQIEVDPACGNGALDANEACDDGGNAQGDGCSPTCTVENGYACSGEPSVCTLLANALCGNGQLDGTEACDDNNVMGGDGCNAQCEVEAGYVCDTGEPSVCMLDGVTSTGIKINELMANPSNTADTNCDGTKSSTHDEFVELVNASAAPIALAGLTLSDDFGVRHVFPANTPALQPGKAFVVWGGGSPACAGVTAFQVASTGLLGLSNDNDKIILKSGSQILAEVSFINATAGISSNVSPDVTGTAFVDHDTISTTKFSPGKRANGTAF